MSRTQATYVFRGIKKSKAGERLWVCGSLSYTQMREPLRNKLQHLGYPPNNFGVHAQPSCWGATAVANAGVSEQLFQWHGRWKGSTAKDGYIQLCQLWYNTVLCFTTLLFLWASW